MDALAAPAWLVALATAFGIGANFVLKIKANGNGHGSPFHAQVTTALQAVTVTLTALTERLAHLPTREDLSAIAEKNRHDTRNALSVVSTTLGEHLERVEANLEKSIERIQP